MILSYLHGEVQSFRFGESVPMKKFSPPQMKEVSFPTPHTLHPTPSFKSGDDTLSGYTSS
ncbi:hypothetical protein B1L04_01065 [Microcystis aeruginosa KW]|uniref:Uncharacterized protein n=1 Tax=Microcystis aeruginosa KW TaxID=1960155 RepID=A0A1V4BZP6_MICAE|nr:hypothetical protein B1L04_01065 [Microcystis aeruginosa KW]